MSEKYVQLETEKIFRVFVRKNPYGVFEKAYGVEVLKHGGAVNGPVKKRLEINCTTQEKLETILITLKIFFQIIQVRFLSGCLLASIFMQCR